MSGIQCYRFTQDRIIVIKTLNVSSSSVFTLGMAEEEEGEKDVRERQGLVNGK